MDRVYKKTNSREMGSAGTVQYPYIQRFFLEDEGVETMEVLAILVAAIALVALIMRFSGKLTTKIKGVAGSL